MAMRTPLFPSAEVELPSQISEKQAAIPFMWNIRSWATTPGLPLIPILMDLCRGYFAKASLSSKPADGSYSSAAACDGAVFGWSRVVVRRLKKRRLTAHRRQPARQLQTVR